MIASRPLSLLILGILMLLPMREALSAEDREGATIYMPISTLVIKRTPKTDTPPGYPARPGIDFTATYSGHTGEKTVRVYTDPANVRADACVGGPDTYQCAYMRNADATIPQVIASLLPNHVRAYPAEVLDAKISEQNGRIAAIKTEMTTESTKLRSEVRDAVTKSLSELPSKLLTNELRDKVAETVSLQLRAALEQELLAMRAAVRDEVLAAIQDRLLALESKPK